MKSNWLKKLASAFALTGALFFGNAAEAGIVTDRFPIQIYVDRQLSTYNHAGDSSRAGWADANNDLIHVYSVSNGWARISHPGSGGRTVNRYCRVNELFADPNYSNRTARVKGAQSAYRTNSGSATIGSVSNNEEVVVLADNGTRAQIIYRLNNGAGYKIGWVPSSSVQGGASSGGAPSKGNGDVDGDGQITKSDVDMLLAYIQGKRGDLLRKDNADLNGDGSIDIFDVTAVNNILRNGQQSNSQTTVNSGNMSYNETQVINRITQLYTTSGYRLNTKYNGSGQCRGFANKVYQTLFAVGYVGGYTDDNFGASTYPSSYSVGSIKNFASNDVNAVKMLFSKAKPGAFIQMGRRYKLNSSRSAASPHSAILVASDNNGATFYEANTDGKNTIKKNHYTWVQLADKNKGFTIYLPNNYRLK